MMRAAVLTSSDAGARGEREDTSGERLCALVKELGELADYRVLPDEEEQLEALMRQWITDGIDLIVTTGGTGLGPRDVMPEVTRRLITREIPGMAEAMRVESAKHTPFGMISRQVVGTVDHTLIINFPGSPKAIDELWPVVHPVLVHLVDLLHGKTRHEKS
jgi:molybdenum cofactor synthesis domain-containing protein